MTSAVRGHGPVKLIPWGVVVLHLLLATWIPIAHSARHGHDRDFIDLGALAGEESQAVIGSVCPFCSVGLGAFSPGLPESPPVLAAVSAPAAPEFPETVVSTRLTLTKLARAPPLA